VYAVAVADGVVDRSDPPIIDDPINAPEPPGRSDSPDRSDGFNSADVKGPFIAAPDERCVREILSCVPLVACAGIENAESAVAWLKAVSLRVG
jgi:hypothetical protein